MADKNINLNKDTTKNVNTNNLQKKHKLPKSREDEQDGIIFADLLQSNNSTNSIFNTNQQQTIKNQQIIKFEDENKKQEQKIDNVNQNQSKSIADVQQAQHSQTTEFCKALQDNHDKHNFEVNLPKLGTFRISTERAGQKLHFSVSSKEKIAHDWLKTHQSSIEQNVGQDLNMDVSLGINYVV